MDFEEQLIQVVGKIPALSNRRDLFDINVNLKWNGEMSVYNFVVVIMYANKEKKSQKCGPTLLKKCSDIAVALEN